MPFLVLVMLFEVIRNYFKKEELDNNVKAKNKVNENSDKNEDTEENESIR